MLRMSGIEREVYLYTKPKVSIADLNIDAGLDDAYRNGLFKLQAAIENRTEKVASRLLRIRLSD